MKPDFDTGSGGLPFQIDEFYLDLQEDGSKISILSKEEIIRRPFPGLRPFKTSEFQLYNGRIGQAEELIKRLKKNHFLAVIGSSGTGKSSLVRAGLIPQLFGGYLHGAGSKWDIAICRPGKDPVENLAIALASIKTHTKEAGTLYEDFTNFESQLDGSIYGLLDAKESLDINSIGNAGKTSSNLLIIIDQFEELFRFDRKDLGKENIENHFVNLLLKAALDPAHSVYVIITMRSEFLGDCVKYRGLPEAINEGQYLVPQLTRNELKEVIENPVRLAGKNISASLVELLVNEIEESKLQDSLDQLPILQHALMRTYNEALKDGPGTVIGYEHYQRTGEMEKALANHAESKFKELGDAKTDEKQVSKKQQLAKMIFQALTDAGADQKGGRRPTELKNIYSIARSLNAAEPEVNEVINHFRDNDTSFIMPPINTILYPSLIIDISHESLMRNWARLNEWITEEVKLGNLYKLLNERRELHESDNEEWLRGMLLRELQDWEDKHPGNATWAARYNPLPKKISSPALHERLYRKNLQFLHDSVSVHEKMKEEERKELQDDIAREQKEKSTKKMIRVLTIAAVISFLFGILAFAERNNSSRQRKIAEANAVIAVRQKSLADSNAIEAKRNFDAASVQRRIAEDQRKIAEANADLAYKQSIKLKQYAEEAGKQKNIALLLKDSAEKKKEDFQKQLVKNALKNEAFYFSNSLDQFAKEAIIDSLFKTPSFDTRQIELAKYIDVNLLNQINEAVKIKENINQDPVKNLRLAQQIWDNNHHPVLKDILLGIVNDNIFSKGMVDLSRSIDINKASLAVANNNEGFAFNNGRQVVTGRNENNQLLINENSFDDQFDRFVCGLDIPVSPGRNINFLNYNDSNRVVALIDSFKVELGLAGRISDIIPIPGLADYPFARFSADGKRVLLADRDGNVFLKNAFGIKHTIAADTIGNYRNKTLGNENIFFSNNSRYLLVNVDGRSKIIGKDNRVMTISDWDDEYIDAAAFTPDSKSIIIAAEGKLSARDTLLNRYNNLREIDMRAVPFTRAGLAPNKLKTMEISKDGKRMLVTQKDDRIFLLETRNRDSLFRKNAATAGNFRVKEIGNGKNKFRATFYNDSTVITVQDGGTISTWYTYPDFDDPGTAIAAVFPKKSFKEKLQDGTLGFTEVMASGNATDLNTAADYYYRNEKTDYAKKIYQQLLDHSPAEMRGTYLSRILLLNAELNTVDRINNKLDPKRFPTDTIKAYRLLKVNRLKENIALVEEQARLCSNKALYTANLSTLYGSLAFNQLFTNDFEDAIVSANRGLKLDPRNDWIYTNVALSNLLAGKYMQAEAVYRKYRTEMFSDKSRTFKDAFLADFKDMEEAGIIASQKQFASDVARIKKMLEDERP